MTTRKRNKWLEDDLSEEDDVGKSEVEEKEIRKGGICSKRRKLNYLDENDYEIDQLDDNPSNVNDDGADEDRQKDKKSSTDTLKGSRDKPSAMPLSRKSVISSAAASKRSGVIYLSRIPPFMKPTKLRSLLSPFGEIGRIFLSPEDPSSYSRRIKAGGNKKRSFTDGWVEFVSKIDAKRAVELLNT